MKEFYMNIIQKDGIVDMEYEDEDGYRRVVYETKNKINFVLDVYFNGMEYDVLFEQENKISRVFPIHFLEYLANNLRKIPPIKREIH
jgi:hypothetical protein